MEAIATVLPGVTLVRPRRFEDRRGWFMETWRRDDFAALGIVDTFVQDNQSFSTRPGTLRGLHFQRPPRAQGKIVRVVSGRIFDVVVDLRRSSPAFGRHAVVEMSAETGESLYIPIGCAHGFCTLVADTGVTYRCTDYYAPDSEGGVLWSDPALAIPWPTDAADATLAERDRNWPRLAELGPIFD
jgi:dTDP-4-dehydrorhamnose 3,5-epimerase